MKSEREKNAEKSVFSVILQTREQKQAQTKKRAENGTRTRDPQLGKLMLYQLSYFRIVKKNFKIPLDFNTKDHKSVVCGLIVCCLTRIRTSTDSTKNCSATITP